MAQTEEIVWGDIRMVLGRSSVADARVRKETFNALPQNLQTGDNSVLTFVLTQLVECQGLPFKRLTAVPLPEHMQELIETWDQQDETFPSLCWEKIQKLRQAPDASKNAPTAPLHATTSAQVATPVPLTTTPRSR